MLRPDEQLVLGHAGLTPQARATLQVTLGNRAVILDSESGNGLSAGIAGPATPNTVPYYPTSAGTALFYRRDILTGITGDDTLTLDQTPYASASTTLKVLKNGNELSSFGIAFTGNVGTLGTTLLSGDLIDCSYWSATSPGISVLSNSGGSGGDPLFGLVVALLHFQGSGGSTTFTDQKSNTWAATGNAQISTANFKWGASSLLLDGNNDGISSTASQLALGNGDYCIEFWLSSTGANATGFTQQLVDYRTAEPTDSVMIELNSGAIDSGADVYINGSVRTSNSTRIVGHTDWKHIAVYRSSGVTLLAVGGVITLAGYTSSSNYTQTKCNLGMRFAAVSGDLRSVNGYIDDLRITVGPVGSGAARYGPSNFTPPTAQFPDSV